MIKMKFERVRDMQLPAILMATLLLIACGSETQQSAQAPTPTQTNQEPTPGEEQVVIAEWNDGNLLLGEIDSIAQIDRKLAAVSLPQDVSKQDFIKSERQQVVRDLLDNYLLIAEAKANGLEVTEAEKEELLRQFKSQFQTEEQYQENLESAGQTEESLKEVLANIELGRKCMEHQQKQLLESLTPETMRNYYQDHIEDKFTIPGRYDINRVVIFPNDERTREEAKQLAEKYYQEVKAKIASATGFDAKRKVMQDYAYQYSDGPEASYNYGYCIHYDTPNASKEYSPEFVQSLRQTEVGELSDVVPNAEGYGFFLVKEKSDAYVQPFESETVQKLIPRMMLREKLQEWKQGLYEKYQVEIHNERFNMPLQVGSDAASQTVPGPPLRAQGNANIQTGLDLPQSE